MGLIKWIRRRLDADQDRRQRNVNNELDTMDEAGYMRPLQLRFPPTRPGELCLPIHGAPAAIPKTKRRSRIFRSHRIKSFSDINNPVRIVTPMKTRALDSTLQWLDLDVMSRTALENVYEEIPGFLNCSRIERFNSSKVHYGISPKPILHSRSCSQLPESHVTENEKESVRASEANQYNNLSEVNLRKVFREKKHKSDTFIRVRKQKSDTSLRKSSRKSNGCVRKRNQKSDIYIREIIPKTDAVFVDYSFYPRPGPAGAEHTFSNNDSSAEQVKDGLDKSLFDFDTPLACRTTSLLTFQKNYDARSLAHLLDRNTRYLGDRKVSKVKESNDYLANRNLGKINESERCSSDNRIDIDLNKKGGFTRLSKRNRHYLRSSSGSKINENKDSVGGNEVGKVSFESKRNSADNNADIKIGDENSFKKISRSDLRNLASSKVVKVGESKRYLADNKVDVISSESDSDHEISKIVRTATMKVLQSQLKQKKKKRRDEKKSGRRSSSRSYSYKVYKL